MNTQEEQHRVIPVTRLLDLLSYDIHTGKVSVRKSGRVVMSDETGSVTIYDPSLKVKRKMKLDILAWVLFHHKELPQSYKILHKNLNLEDNSAKNLLAILRQEYSKVTEALNNLDGYLKVQLHSSDQYKYVMHYRIDGIDKRGTFDDIDTARAEMHQMELYFVKLINKYAITV